MRKSLFKKMLSFFLSVSMIFSFCGCDGMNRGGFNAGEGQGKNNLSISGEGRVNNFSFSTNESEIIKFSSNSVNAVLKTVNEQTADYFLSYLYEISEVKKRLKFDAFVKSHQYSALNEEGELKADYLTDIIIKNNDDFLAEKSYRYEKPTRDYILDIAGLIVDTVDIMRAKYPDIDWQRVYCNLGNLKILYNVGMLSYAQVSKDMILSVSKNNTEIVLNMKGENGFRNVLIHEIMHIIQMGCECENIENCSRRAGISLYWDDFSLNTTDWVWFVEGSAERNMCNITGDAATTYQYKMDYICSFTMSLLLKDDIKPDTMETITFYDDPELLFNAFDCKTEAEREEILNLMITLNVLQMQPENFYEVYKKATGINVTENEETQNDFSYSLKPAVCITLSKYFFKSLVAFLEKETVSVNDLCFLLTLYEGHLNQHLRFNDQSKYDINKPFFDSYLAMRNALFVAIKIENPDVDLKTAFEEYNITALGNKLLNAELSMLSADKKAFLAERAEWQAGLSGLGVKLASDK